MGNVNLVTNPSFETNTTGWTPTNATLTRDTSAPAPGVGVATLKLVATAAAKVSVAYTITGLTVGKNYVASFYVKTKPVGPNFSVIANIGGTSTSMPVIPASDQYRRRIQGFVATATSMTLTITSEQNNTINDAIYIDCVQVTQDTLTPYFDGSYPSCSWTGTAHASTSTASFLANIGSPTTDEVVLVNNFCLNTYGWNITSKTGRYTLAAYRGDDITVPGVNGKTFVPNKPRDSGLWSLSMFVMGTPPDGSIPPWREQRSVMADNISKIIQNCVDNTAPVTLVTWQPDGDLLTTKATLIGTNSPLDGAMTMGGRRAEFTLAFEILSGAWEDYVATVVAGTASASWSNQTLSMPPLAGGTGVIDDAVITVTGPITNPVISNAATGTSVSYVGTVPAGQTWVVDSGAWTSKVNGASVIANTTHSGSPRFLLIAPGSYATPPNVTLTGSATTIATNLQVSAKRKFLTG